MSAGRPLRFLTGAIGGWIVVRTALLWPVEEIVAPPLVSTPAPTIALGPSPAPVAAAERRSGPGPATIAPRASVTLARVARDIAPEAAEPEKPMQPARPALVALAATPIEAGGRSADIAPGRVALVAPLPVASLSRLSGSAWVIGRGAGVAAGLSGSQLGASQAGARLAYAVDADRRIALVGRVASPLGRGAREVAVGAELRLVGDALRVFAERRFAVDGGRGGPSVGLVGGVFRPLPAGFRLEGYGQAGAIARDRVEAFADGAMRMTRPVATLGAASVDIGAGAWGGAQRGAERLDVGPTIGGSLPVGGRSLRVTLDWRQRIAGRSRPGSGPALSVGTDF